MPAFVVGHEEAFAPAVVHLGNVDRTARDKTKLVLAQHGLCSWRSGDVVVSSREGVGVERVVAIEQENRPVQAVRAALAYDVDLCRAESLVRRISSARYLEFLDGILRQHHGRRYEGCVGVDQTVERVIVALRPAA